jgi:DNA-binding NtrC family response regulator
VRTLITFVGQDDPYSAGLSGEGEWAGPAIVLSREIGFDEVHLLAEPRFEPRAIELKSCLEALFKGLSVVSHSLPLADTGDARSLQPLLRSALLATEPGTDGRTTFVALTPAFPAAMAAWLSLPADALRGVRFVEALRRRYAGDRGPSFREIPLPAAATSPGRSDPQVLREPAAAYGMAARAFRATPATAHPPPLPSMEDAVRGLGICAGHPEMRRALEVAAVVAAHTVPVLICGETGTGKGLFARLIHVLSGRDPCRFISVNCAALPEHLIESILFGHRKGSFTGASQDQAGKFELANGGTLFLDEIGELPLALQPKLLKAVEERIVEPLGARAGISVDVRVIGATHRDLRREVEEKRFREDLFYRLSFVEIRLPPLRERRQDIRHIALGILDDMNRSLRSPKSLTPGAILRLEAQDWRGNVRDLANAIGRSVLLAPKDVLDADDLLIESPASAPDPLSRLPTPHESFSLEGFLADARKQLILRALDMAHGNQSAAARLLGITPQSIHKFLRASPPVT